MIFCANYQMSKNDRKAHDYCHDHSAGFRIGQHPFTLVCFLEIYRLKYRPTLVCCIENLAASGLASILVPLDHSVAREEVGSKSLSHLVGL